MKNEERDAVYNELYMAMHQAQAELDALELQGFDVSILREALRSTHEELLAFQRWDTAMSHRLDELEQHVRSCRLQ